MHYNGGGSQDRTGFPKERTAYKADSSAELDSPSAMEAHHGSIRLILCQGANRAFLLLPTCTARHVVQGAKHVSS